MIDIRVQANVRSARPNPRLVTICLFLGIPKNAQVLSGFSELPKRVSKNDYRALLRALTREEWKCGGKQRTMSGKGIVEHACHAKIRRAVVERGSGGKETAGAFMEMY